MKVLEHSDWLKMSNHPNCHHLVMKAKIKFRKKIEKFRLIEKKNTYIVVISSITVDWGQVGITPWVRNGIEIVQILGK